MAWIVKRGNSLYLGWQQNGRDRYKSLRTLDEKAGEIAKKEKELEVDKGVELPEEQLSMELSELIARYKKDVDLSPKTLRGNDYGWRKFMELTKVVRVDQVTPEVLKDFKVSMAARKFKPTYTWMCLRDIKKLLNFAVEEEIIEKSPMDKITMPTLEEVWRFMTVEEEAKLMAVADPFMRRIITLALKTGLRFSQIVFMDWKQVDIDGGRIRVEKQKRQKARRIPMLSGVQEALGEPKASGRVFEGITEDHVKGKWRRIVKNSGIKGRLRFHDLRHTCASRLAPILGPYGLRDFFGWSSVAMADRYVHTREEEIKAKLKGL